MKKVEMRLKSAMEIIKKSKSALIFYKNKKRQCYLAYKFIIKTYPAYDDKSFYKKMKPYILNEKNITSIKEENWIKENQNKQEEIKNYLEAIKIEERRFKEFCAGEKDIWENTYGTLCPYT